MLAKVFCYFTIPLLLLLGTSLGNSAPPMVPGAPQGFNPGPDIITGDIGEIGGLEQFGSAGTQVGLAVSTTSCNAGNQLVNFLALPATIHPVIPHNLYRMSGGSNNDERFEQIGQSWMKHAFGADQANNCFQCQPGGDFNHLGVGCSDTYANFQNATQTDLGSRALINPFTGVFQSTANDHTGHTHTGTSHRILVEANDLNTTLNPGATYYAEVQYISSDEYAWCQSHPGECNMYNNASYRRYNVSGTTSFTFAEVGTTVRMLAAVHAWPGATINPIEPDPGVDGRAYIAYKVTNPSAGVWHYEYALYNENLDRAIQSFSVPLGCAITLSNPGFHAPLNHPGFPNDGTVGDAGFSNAPWTRTQTISAVTWNSETFAQNQNANAIRWGTLYNFRFDSSKPPVATHATIGFFKTGAPTTVAILGPNACEGVPTPTPTITPAPTPSPSPTPTLTPSVTPPASPSPTPTSDPTAPSSPLPTVTPSATPPTSPTPGPSPTPTPTITPSPIPTLTPPPTPPGSPSPSPFATVSPSPTVSPSSTPSVTPLASPTLTPGATATPSATPTPPGAQALNLSTRMLIQTGDRVGIGGFIITGSAPKHVLLRALGPSLPGVSGVLADPAMTLFGSTGPIISNNNWRDDPVQEAAIIATGIPPSNDLEAAIDATLAPGSYTAVVSGNNQTTGIGLVEIYDLDPVGLSKLANISTRAFVGRNAEITIAGFILGRYPGDDRVILRGIGPSLVCPGGCSLTLTDPALELRDGNGARLIYNYDWQDDPAQAAEITAAGLPLSHHFEAGIAMTLPPGSYTALLVGERPAGSTGLGLIEVYDRGNGIAPPTPTPSPTASPGVTPLPTPTPPAATPTPSPGEACMENFDGTPTVFLPGGSWAISTVAPYSTPKCLFAPDPDIVSDEIVDSVNIAIHSTAAVLTFRNNFDTEHKFGPPEEFWDGFVLEVSVNGGAFTDVTDPLVGGTFVSGAYTGEIEKLAGNPLAGRMAWSGNSAGYILTRINFPASLNGQTIKLRFRMGTDISVDAPGVRVDNFVLTGGSCP